jgi:hypothetical protein
MTERVKRENNIELTKYCLQEQFRLYEKTKPPMNGGSFLDLLIEQIESWTSLIPYRNSTPCRYFASAVASQSIWQGP